MAAIQLRLRPGSGGQLLVDGQDITQAVSQVRLTAGRGETHISLSLAVLDTVTVDGEATIGIPRSTHDALVALGWTPPAEGQDG